MSADSQAAAPPADGRDLIEHILARVREKGGRATSAKRLLLQALLDNTGHRSAEELAADVQSRAPQVNLSTIYRNLDELEQLQVIDRTRLSHGPATYHLASAAHGHLDCEQCGSITEVPDSMFSDLAAAAKTRYGFVINPHHFAVTGRCATCQP